MDTMQDAVTMTAEDAAIAALTETVTHAIGKAVTELQRIGLSWEDADDLVYCRLEEIIDDGVEDSNVTYEYVGPPIAD